MCISARASIVSFFTNLFSCIALIKFGRPELYFYNLITGFFMIFVSFMQLVDFGIWIDLDCKKGTNKLASILGPLLNHLQPIAMLAIVYSVINYTKTGKDFYNKNIKKLEGTIYDNFNIAKGGFNFIKGINLVHLIIVGIYLGVFFKKAFTTNPEFLCSGVCDSTQNLKWNWYKRNVKLFGKYIGFLGILWHVYILNHLSINPHSNYLRLTLAIFYLLLFASMYLKRKSTAEIWCYIVNFGAIFLLFIQRVTPKNFFN